MSEGISMKNTGIKIASVASDGFSLVRRDERLLFRDGRFFSVEVIERNVGTPRHTLECNEVDVTDDVRAALTPTPADRA